MEESLIAPQFLFRFAFPLRRWQGKWTGGPLQLEERHVLPSFGTLEGRPLPADLRGAWNEHGLYFTLRMTGKKQIAWCRDTRLDDSDGLQIWIDTRDTHNIHRATRFCHRFVFLPFGRGPRKDEPVADLGLINRAREIPKPIPGDLLKVRSEKRIDGYLLECHIPNAALTGFDREEHPRLGFSYAVIDRELGWQVFSVGPEFPFPEDPSLWGTAELSDE